MTTKHSLKMLFVVLLMIFLTAADYELAFTASSESPIPIQILEDPIIEDAKVYAVDIGVDLEEAVRRLKLQSPAGDLNAKLAANESDIFAGSWIQHSPEFKIIVLFTKNGDERLRPYIDGGILADIVEVRTVNQTLAELEKIQADAILTVHDLNIPVESGINIFDNRVELYVINQARLYDKLANTNKQLPDNVYVVQVDKLSQEETDIFAGLSLSQCTSGFSVENDSGTKGITTAAHCNNTQSYGGTDLPFQGSAYGSSYDFQWHTAPGFTVRNLMFDGTYNRYVYSTRHRNDQELNEFVCKHGKATGFTCGYIINKSHQPSGMAATFIRVHRDNVNLSEGGDSGAPWFSGNTAYGVHIGGIGDDAYYMAVNYLSYLDLTVLTE